LHYGGLDERVNAGIPAYEEALKKAGVKYGLYTYEGPNMLFTTILHRDAIMKPLQSWPGKGQ
jgi:hypothetical protein